MAVTQNSYLGDGSTTTYPFTFPYLKKSEIKVSLDATVTTAFTTPTATTVQLNTAPASGVKIKIYRETDSDSLSATFYAGSAIKSEDLNDNFTQNLHATQEVTERYLSNLGGNMVGDLILNEDVAVKFEGATDDAYETTLTVADPTADRTITLPNETGTVITSGSTGQVATGLIANDAIDGTKIADNAINSEHYTDGSIDRVHLAADIIDGTKLADDSVDSAHVAADSLDSEHYAPGSVDTTALANDAVTNAKIADDQIDSEHYVDGSIDTAHIANDAVSADKLANTAVTAGSYTAADLTVDAQGRITAASSGSIGTGEIANDAVDGTKIADNAINSEHYVDGSIDHAHLANDIIDGDNIQDDVINSEHIAAGALDNEHYASGSIDSTKLSAATVVTNSEQASASANDTSFFTTSASDARYFNVSTGDTIKDGQTFPDNDTTIATTAAINDRILDLVDNVGGFVPIANETSFPTANPDPENGTGTIVSIQALASNLTSNGSGVATIANGAGSGVTVTINGLANSTTYAATFGMLVETTATTHTYKFHRLVPKATEVTTVAGNISNINTVANNQSNINSAASNQSNINAAVANATNINTVASNNSNITSVADSLSGTQSYAVTVSNVGGSNYFFIDSVQAPALNLIKGFTYTFDVSASSNSGHPLRFKDGSGNSYTTGVTTSGTEGQAGATVTFAVASNAPSSLRYYCTAHGNSMGNTIATADSNIGKVAGSITNVNTVAGAISNVNTVGGSISNVNTVATNISSVNDFADRYRVASSDPSSNNDTGDLVFNTTSNELRVYNGSAWQGGVTATGNLLSKSGDQMTGNLTFSGSQTVDGRDVSVDGTKLDGIASGAEVNVQSDWNASSGDALILNKPSVGDGGFTQNNFTNTLKGKLDGIATSANNYTHPNHSGEVTSSADGATVVVDNIIDEANLKVSNSPTNGQFLQAQSGNTGGLTWATPANTTYTVGDGGLTQKNFTTTLKNKLDGIAIGAEVNVQSDWNASSGDAQILNKPTIPSATNPGGSNTQVQFNNSGSFAGSSSLTYNSGSGALTATSFVGSLTGDVAGNASSADTVDVANWSSVNNTHHLLFSVNDGAGRNIGLDASLSYNPSSNTLTAGSFSGDGSNLTNLPAAGGSITATASGSIANGAAVYKKSDGTVSTISTSHKMLDEPERSEISQWIDPYTINKGTARHNSSVGACYDATTECVLVAFTSNDSTGLYYGDLWTVVGKVKGSGKDCKIDWGTPQEIYAGSSSTYEVRSYSPKVVSIGGGKAVIVWAAIQGLTMRSRVATISATNKNVSVGTENTDSSTTWYYLQSLISLGSNKFAWIGSGGTTNWDKPFKVVIGTVSGTTITNTVDSTSFAMPTYTWKGFCANADNDKLFISAEYKSGSIYDAKFICGSLSGTSITWGSWTAYTGTHSNTSGRRFWNLPLTWDESNNRLHCFFRCSDSETINGVGVSTRLRTLTATVSGTTLTIDSAFQNYPIRQGRQLYNTAYYFWDGSHPIYDPDLGGIVGFAALNNEDAVISGVSDAVDYNPDTKDPYEIAGLYTSYVTYMTGSGSTYTRAGDTEWSLGGAMTRSLVAHPTKSTGNEAVQTNYSVGVYDTVNKQTIVILAGSYGAPFGIDGGVPSECWAIAVKTTKPSTTASDFIGFAEAAYTNGQTATITTAGGINESQSGLTVGSSYYLQGNGTLSTTPDATYGSIFAGIATAATKLAVSQNNKITLTGVVTSDGDGKTKIAERSITAKKLKTQNWPHRRGLILTSGGTSELEGDRSSDRKNESYVSRVNTPASLEWSTPDWELVDYGNDKVISGGVEKIWCGIQYRDYEYNDGDDDGYEIGKLWTNYRFYKVFYEACCSSSSSADLRLQLLSGNSALTNVSYDGYNHGAYSWEVTRVGSSNENSTDAWHEYIQLSKDNKDQHTGELFFAVPRYQDRFWQCSWVGHSYNVFSGGNQGPTGQYQQSNYGGRVMGSGGLRWRGSSYKDFNGIVLSTGHSSGFSSLTYRVFGMK